MGRVLTGSVAIALLFSVEGQAQDACEVDVRWVGSESIRVIHCDEDPVAMDAAIDRAQESCEEFASERRAECLEAVAASFALRRTAMIRRALREGGTVEAVSDRYAAPLEEVAQIEAEMTPPVQTIDPELEAARAARHEAAERDFREWRARAGLD